MKGPQSECLSKERLEELYVNSDMSLTEVAREIGAHRETVRRWVIRYGLPMKRKARTGPRKEETHKLGEKEWLVSELSEKSISQISRELGTTHHNVWYWMKQHGLTVENEGKSEAVKAGLAKVFPDGRFGELASNWRGGRRKMRSGYIYIFEPDHPHSTKAGYVMEHRLVMEEKLGRYLEPSEIVHHKNGVKDDNRLENLEVMDRSTHVSNHFDALAKLHEAEERIAELDAMIISKEMSSVLLESRIAELEAENEELRKGGRINAFPDTKPSTESPGALSSTNTNYSVTTDIQFSGDAPLIFNRPE